MPSKITISSAESLGAESSTLVATCVVIACICSMNFYAIVGNWHHCSSRQNSSWNWYPFKLKGARLYYKIVPK